MSNYLSLRRFFFERSDGARLEVNGEHDIWLSAPSGLGAARNNSYAELGSGCFAVTESREAQQTIAFSLTFTGRDPYSAYQRFLAWLNPASALYLGYQPHGSGGAAYRRSIKLKSISKAELNSVGWLATAVTVECTAPWMQEISLATSHLVTDALWYWEPTVEGQLPAAFEVRFTAAAARQIKYLELSCVPRAATAKKIKFTSPLSLAAGETLLISTRPDDYRVQRLSTDGAGENVLNEVDISYDPVLLLPQDATVAELILAADAHDAADIVECTMITYYRSV